MGERAGKVSKSWENAWSILAYKSYYNTTVNEKAEQWNRFFLNLEIKSNTWEGVVYNQRHFKLVRGNKSASWLVNRWIIKVDPYLMLN